MRAIESVNRPAATGRPVDYRSMALGPPSYGDDPPHESDDEENR